jgi:hypothetical protein
MTLISYDFTDICQRAHSNAPWTVTTQLRVRSWVELSTVSVSPPAPGELSVAVNSENMDDALRSVLMGYHDGEDEGRLMVQPLNVLYPNTENEMVFPDWVIRCAERIHSRVGITYPNPHRPQMAVYGPLDLH